MYNLTDVDKKFIATYDVEKFDRPSVAIDTVILTLNDNFELLVLMNKRNELPFKDTLQLPGGFVDIHKDLDEQVKDLVYSKTGVKYNDLKFEQLYTYGKVDRDPRTRVISVTYFAVLRQGSWLTELEKNENNFWVTVYPKYYERIPFAFDHKDILEDALKRIANKVDYTDIALEFLADKNHFTLFELKKVYEELLGHSIGLANFRRDILKRYGDRFEVIEGLESNEYSKRPSKVYRLK